MRAICSGSIKERRSGSSTGLVSRGICRSLPTGPAIDQTFQFYGKYDAVRQGDSVPVSLSALVSVEGADNFQEHYSPALGVAVSRMVADRLAVYATPVWVHNTAAILNIDRDTFFVGIGGRVRVSATVYLVGGVVSRASWYRPDKGRLRVCDRKTSRRSPLSTQRQQRPRETFGQLARGGFPDSLYLGFNLARKFF
jgi:Membrane bound beta barrel domain (DUF5777)